MKGQGTTTRSVLNTPEFFFIREGDAFAKIGSHMLIAALYEGGLVIGNKFHERLQRERQWLSTIDETKLLCGYGDWGDVQEVQSFIEDRCINIRDFLNDDYITVAYLRKNLRRLLKDAYIESSPVEANFLIADVKEAELNIVEFRGSVSRVLGFGILGGYSYTANPAHVHPLKDAITTLEGIFAGRNALASLDEAMDAVKQTLFLHDPPSKKEIFELTVFENNSLHSVYVKREKKSE